MNEITDTSLKAATASVPDATARLRVIADILDHHERRSAAIRARQSLPVAVNDPRTVAAILDHHEARRAARSAAAPAIRARESRVYGEGPAVVALLLDSHGCAR